MRPGTKVTTLNGKRHGTLIETRETPNGTSAKVKFDDRKIASWYWLKDLRAE